MYTVTYAINVMYVNYVNNVCMECIKCNVCKKCGKVISPDQEDKDLESTFANQVIDFYEKK